jgi:hypothetical protein
MRGRDANAADPRAMVLDWLDLLGSAQEQLDYQRSVPIANVSAELFCVWFDDLVCYFEEGVFTEAELDPLRTFTKELDSVGQQLGATPPDIRDLVQLPSWLRIMAMAVETAEAIRSAGSSGG